MRNLTSIIFTIFAYLIPAPVCNQFSIPVTTSTLAHMHASPRRAPLPRGHWYPVPFYWALDRSHLVATTWGLASYSGWTLKPYLSHPHVETPPYSAHECVPRPVILMNEKISSFYEIEELCFYQLLMLKETGYITNITSQSQNCDNVAS